MFLMGPKARSERIVKFLNNVGTITLLPLKSVIAENGRFQLSLDFKGKNVIVPTLFKNFTIRHDLVLYKDSF